MPLVQTRGAASAQGFGEFAQATAAIPYIEDVFSTYLYTGTGASQTITNDIDILGKGGLVWTKARTSTIGATHLLGSPQQTNILQTSNTGFDWASVATIYSSFNSNGFSITNNNNCSENNKTFVSWTFREQPKFFDVVTYTGTGSNTTIAHSLGSVPGSIIVKRTDTTADWAVYHRSLANTQYLVLNTSAAAATGATWWNSTTPTSAVFSVGTDASVNASGGTYIAYIFAHDAGGFGLAGTDNVISCGTFTTDGSGNATVSLGYEPQWLLWKPASDSGNWQMVDNMRGWVSGGSGTARLFPNNSGAEVTTSVISGVNATGFNIYNASASSTQIYIAIRRGPMKVPTVGTSVFLPITSSATTGTALTTTFPVDMQIAGYRTIVDSGNRTVVDRLRGASSTTTSTGQSLVTSSTSAETSASVARNWDNTGFQFPSYWSGDSTIFYSFRRAPSFFDEVCYTGTGVARSLSHNLGVAPELAIVKDRNVGSLWYVQNAAMFAAYTGVSPGGYYCVLNTTAALIDGGGNYVYSPTTSTISVDNGVNFNTRTYVAYLFATLAGVSKVGTYTGNGTTQTIDCGFGAGGVRFVLIKRTDSTGDWYTYDTARGMTVLTDPYLLLNSTAAEVATLGSVTTVSTGFALNSSILAAINVSAGTYIFLAIA